MEKQLTIQPCVNDTQKQQVAKIADEIWHEYFPFLLNTEQIDYMVEKFCSFEAMVDLEKHHYYHYFMVHKGEELIGYLALAHEETQLFLSKIYLKKSARGHHYASEMFEYVKDHARKYQYDSIYLTCNKHNTHSLDVYQSWGFVKTDEVVTDIGQGYVMDDYILEYTL